MSVSLFRFSSAGGAEGLLARRKAKEALAMETPWEASLRKERERKRARKKAIKERIEAEEADDDEDDGEVRETAVRSHRYFRRTHDWLVRHSGGYTGRRVVLHVLVHDGSATWSARWLDAARGSRLARIMGEM